MHEQVIASQQAARQCLPTCRPITLHCNWLFAQPELVIRMQVVLAMLTRHVDRAAGVRNTTAVEYVRAVMYAQANLPPHVGWETFYLRAGGTTLVSYLVRTLSSPWPHHDKAYAGSQG